MEGLEGYKQSKFCLGYSVAKAWSFESNFQNSFYRKANGTTVYNPANIAEVSG
jgi:hypothetical protein